MYNDDSFHIDVKEILQAKAPDLARKIPGFVVDGLAKLICQDDVNRFLEFNGDAKGVDFMNNAMKYFEVGLTVEGAENLPEAGQRSIFVSNHPLGGMDGICLSAFLGNHYSQNIKYLVNDILYFIEPLQTIFVPVNKHGAQGREAVAMLHEALASDAQIITFPAGLCSRKEHGKISDTPWKKMFISKAIEYERDIVPVYFDGKNSNFFYNLALWRKRLKIKFNIEMLFLPREFFGAKGRTFRAVFGKPIPYRTFDSAKSPQQWTNYVRNKVYNTHN
ncbi:MAG: 1-acyl-sn-glycerol-3-phosphate acyltransferase [Dysgonamonadaceae bacterium]|jgi:putative hemolysin|nr:1-acyl-sn-glycerol-3-phosphate acyltransferase [Dysgonamonadaceae bacterium]